MNALKLNGTDYVLLKLCFINDADEWREQVAVTAECGAIRRDGLHEIFIKYDALQAAVITYRMTQNK